MADALSGLALVTGGGRGIGASVARELAAAGVEVAVTGRTREQVEAVAEEIRGRALVGDVCRERTSSAGSTASASWISSSTTRASPGPDVSPSTRSRSVVARVRGQRARRIPVLRSRAAGDDRAAARADRDRRLGGGVLPRRDRDWPGHRVRGEQGGAEPLHRGARRADPRVRGARLPHLPGSGSERDDGADLRRRLAMDAARARATVRPRAGLRSRRRASAAATSTPSTTTSRS